jgi:hypothetical protein
MPHPRRKTPDELMCEAFWTRRDIIRVFRKAPASIDRYINHPDPKKRLPGYLIGGQFMAEKTAVLRFFRFKPLGKEEDKNNQITIGETGVEA